MRRLKPNKRTTNGLLIRSIEAQKIGLACGRALQEELIARHVSPAAVKAAAIVLLRPEPPLVAPPQYKVFGLSRHQLSMINFNNDGLANVYCPQHHIVNVHGVAPTKAQRERFEWEALIDDLQLFPELKGVDIPGLILPQREPDELALGNEYRKVEAFLLTARRLILVGYSFGGMDDHLAYKAVVSTIRNRRVPIALVQPNPKDLAGRLAEDAKAGLVLPVPAYWDSLSGAILSSIDRQRRKTCNHARLCVDCVSYYYEALADRR